MHSSLNDGVELIALAAMGKEAKWIRDLLMNIRSRDTPIPYILVYCNSAATLLAI